MRVVEYAADDLVAGASRFLLQGQSGTAKAAQDGQTDMPSLANEHTIGRIDVKTEAGPGVGETYAFTVFDSGGATACTITASGTGTLFTSKVKVPISSPGIDAEQLAIEGVLSGGAALPGFTKAMLTLLD